MARPELTPQLALLEEALTILFCRVDDAYYQLNPKGRNYETLKELSDSEVITLALFQQLPGVESERSFLREVGRFFWHLFPGAVGLHPSSLDRRVRKLRRYFEPLRRTILPELVGDPETLIVDSTLLSVLHPREVSQSGGWGSSSAGAAWVRWGSFSVYGVKLHLLCATNRVPISYELTPANTADLCLSKELLAEADLGGEVARKLLGDLAYRSGELEEELAEMRIVLLTNEASARRPGVRQQIEITFSSLKRTFLGWGRHWPPRWWDW
jgi:Transposase DDE domain